MTIEDAIERFERQLNNAIVVLDRGFGTRPGEDNRLYRERKEMAEITLSALRAQQEAEENEPLTLDELRQMDGEPVWFNVLVDGEGVWGLVCVDDNVLTMSRGGMVSITDVVGHAYRHKPEEKTI